MSFQYAVTATQLTRRCSRQYVFDAIPMFALVVIYSFFPPGRYVQMSFKQTKGQARIHSSNSSDVESHALQDRA